MSQSRNDETDKAESLRRSHGQLSRMMRQGRSFSGRERNCVYLNTGAVPEGNGRFSTISAASGLDFPDDGRAVAMVDWDHDGDLDLWISNRNAPRLRLMRNDTTSGNRFVAFRLVGNGTTTNRDAIGARVELTIGGSEAKNLIKTIRAGEGFLAQGSKWVHFGMGAAQEISKVIVRWPGGGREEFGGIQVDHRYELLQGSGEAKAWRRAPATLVLTPSSQELRQPTAHAKIPLLTPLPKPTVAYLGFDNSQKTLRTGLGLPVLITLWVSWCPHCQAELKEFTKREQDIRAAGLGILALSVDGLGADRSTPAIAQRLLSRLKFPFASGRATSQLVQDFQNLHDLVIPLERPIPVPTSFLIDEDGRLSVIYRGRIHVDDILKDIKHSQGERADRLERVAPIPGRAIRNPQIESDSKENGARTLFYMGTVMGDSGRFEDAIKYYLDVLAAKPDSFKTHYNLGLMYTRRHNLQPALRHFRKAINLKPDSVPGHRTLGNLLLASGNPELAAPHYEEVIRINPEDAEAITNLGVAFANQGNLGRAVEQFERMILINPEHAQARYNLGALLLAQGDLERAADNFLKVIRIKPDYPEAHYKIGVLSEQQGNPTRAAEYYKSEIRVNPSSVKARNNLGMILEKQGNLAEAVAYYEQAVRIKPDDKVARNNLERARAKLEKGK